MILRNKQNVRFRELRCSKGKMKTLAYRREPIGLRVRMFNFPIARNYLIRDGVSHGNFERRKEIQFPGLAREYSIFGRGFSTACSQSVCKSSLALAHGA